MTDAPVTQGQLHQALAPIRVELVDLRADVTGLRTDVDALRTDVDALRTDVTGLRTDVTGLRTDVDALRTDVTGLRTDVDALRTELKQDIATVIRHIGEAASHVANVMIENTRSQIAALDDKYRDGPRDVEMLRGALDAHVADVAVHVKPSTPRPRARARRTRRS